VWYEHACDRERRAERGGQAEPPRVEGAECEEERDLLAVLVAQLVELVRLSHVEVVMPGGRDAWSL